MKTKTMLVPIFGAAALTLSTMAAAGGHDKGHGDWFKKLDSDGNGTISQTEINAAGDAHFKKMDADGNGTLSKEEFNARKVKMLNKVDADGNGEISQEEWQTAKEKMRAHKGDKKAK